MQSMFNQLCMLSALPVTSDVLGRGIGPKRQLWGSSAAEQIDKGLFLLCRGHVSHAVDST